MALGRELPEIPAPHVCVMKDFLKRSPLRFLALLGVSWLGACSAVNPLRQAPSSATEPAIEPQADTLAQQLAEDPGNAGRQGIDPARVYSLTELIALAQQNNRTTRLAWQQARAASVGVGLSSAEFYPMLAMAASYGGGLYALDASFNNDLSGLAREAGILGALLAGADAGQLSNPSERLTGAYTAGTAMLGLRWMLLDFGARSAKLEAAKLAQVAANLNFNAAHQKLVFSVTQTFYALEGTRRQAQSARTSAASAAEILAAAEEQSRRGFLTEPELLQARQVKAEADYGLATAEAAASMALVDLCEAAGVPPTPGLKLAPSGLSRNRQKIPATLDAAIRSALQHRPDLLAKVAIVQAAEANLRAARRDRLPKIALEGGAGYSRFDAGVSGAGPLDQFGLGLQNYAGFLTVQWPIFTGFAEENKVRGAEIARESAREEMELAREGVIAGVWRAYTRAKNAWAQLEAAEILEKASRSSYDAAQAKFARGSLALPEVLSARAALAQASALVAEAETTSAAAVAALAFESGPAPPR